MPFIANDPCMQELIRRKAETTPPEKLCQEIEALHDALHDMKSFNWMMFRCLRESKATMRRLIALEHARGSEADYVVGPLDRQCAHIVETIGRVKGIIE